MHAERRRKLAAAVGAPVLLVNNGVRARNLSMNPVPFRSDSTFLYYTGCPIPAAAVLIHHDQATLYLEPPEDDDPLWHGAVPSMEEQRKRYGFDRVRPLRELPDDCQLHHGHVLSLAVPDRAQTELAARLSGLDLRYTAHNGPDVLVDAIIAQRRVHDAWELDEMREAARIAARAHLLAMKATRVGGHEREVAAIFDAVVAAEGGTPSYQSIVTVRGEVLHNHHYVNPLLDGQLLLLDGGAETPSGYASDVTRTWPVNGRFSQQQRDAYELVLDAQLVGIDLVRSGTRYRDIHFAATRVIAQGLRDLGLLRGEVDGLVESGATGVFFPHGVGHLLGLDVHDLENFGDRPAYAPGRSRPTQFGARYLRLDLDLVPGLVVTIEPGFYVVPAILHDTALRSAHADQVDFAAAEKWIGFGGIRIEDDVLVTDGTPEVLTAEIPKRVIELEHLVGTGPSAAERLTP